VNETLKTVREFLLFAREHLSACNAQARQRLHFRANLLMNGTDIREIQELLGHKTLETTMTCTHVVRQLKTKAHSPLDDL